MSVTIKSAREIDLMRTAGKLLEEVLNETSAYIKPGISTEDINRYADKLIRERGCIPSFLNYEGYPASVCVSVNEEVVHGIPSPDRFIKEGDIVSLDAGLIYKGYQSDAARTVMVGDVAPEVKKLVEVTEQSFFEGIKFAHAGNHLFEISGAINDYVDQFGYGVVRDLVGHGIGSQMHEDPEIPNFRMRRRGIKLEPGMTLAIEPMINLGTWEVSFSGDGWTVTTKDGKPSAHYENTVLITDGEPELLTLSGR